MTRGEAIPLADLRSAIRAREAWMVALTRDLVRCDSQTPPSDTREAVRVAARYLEDVPGIVLQESTSEPPVTNLVARLGGGRPGRRLVLSGHLDTYPIGERGAWSFDPLGGEISGGRLYGRGSCDMKGGVASLAAVVAAFAECAPDFPGELVLALAGDEESMGELGTQWLIDHVPEVRGDAVIVADVGSPSIPRLGEKGMVWVELEAEGAAAHGAHVHRGANAIDRLIEAILALKRLEALEPRPPEEVTRAIEAARPISEPMGGDGEAASLGSVTVNVGTVRGGTSTNLVPARASASLDIRLPMGVPVARVESAIQAAVARVPGVRHAIVRRYEATWTAPSEPIAVAAVAAAAEVLRTDVRANMRIGGSDARLWRRAGIPTVVAGLTPHGLGGPDEFLELRELVPLAEIHGLTAARFLEGG